MINRKAVYILILSVLFIGNVKGTYAQEEEGPKFKVTPSGRVLIDGAVYISPEKYLFKDGMAIPEARLGAKMEYGKWSSWIDVGIAYGKVGLRNMWIQYDFNSNNSLRVGNFLQPFGMQSEITTSMKPTFEQPIATALYTPGLQLGVMYKFQNPSFYSASAFHVESSALTNAMNYPEFNKQGFSVLTWFAWRKKDSGHPGKTILHTGVSLGFSTPQRRMDNDGYDVHDGFALTANYPTKVTTLAALSAVVPASRNLFKFSPEIMLAKRKVALEAQYFLQTINRKDNLSSYLTQSGYITLRGMILGGDYSYDHKTAQLVYPKKNALELVADYNYSTLSDSKAGIYGGRANSFNFTLNYYFNKYITARLNYSYTHVWDRANFIPVTMSVIQARLMVLF